MTMNQAKKTRVTKKMLAVEMYEKGMNLAAIAELLHTHPSYVANALIERGFTPSYMDLYTSTAAQNEYTNLFKGMGGLRFKNLEAARASVARLDALFQRFKASADRRGMHQCQVLALVGKNRAEGIGKRKEARLFADWLRGILAEPDENPVKEMNKREAEKVEPAKKDAA